MSKRISLESRMLDWIDTAPLPVVQSIMSITVARLKARTKAEMPALPTCSTQDPRQQGQRATDTAATAQVGAA